MRRGRSRPRPDARLPLTGSALPLGVPPAAAAAAASATFSATKSLPLLSPITGRSCRRGSGSLVRTRGTRFWGAARPAGARGGGQRGNRNGLDAAAAGASVELGAGHTYCTSGCSPCCCCPGPAGWRWGGLRQRRCRGPWSRAPLWTARPGHCRAPSEGPPAPGAAERGRGGAGRPSRGGLRRPLHRGTLPGLPAGHSILCGAAGSGSRWSCCPGSRRTPPSPSQTESHVPHVRPLPG